MNITNRTRNRTLGLLLLVAGLGWQTAWADVINVPGDQPTIQAGIDAAVNGDEVVVAPGTYNEIIDLSGKAITVRSSGGAAVTTIDAAGVPDPGDGLPVVRCDNGEGNDTVIEGFTITDGTGDTVLFGIGGFGFGGGIFLNGASPIVRDCTIEANAAAIGAAAFVNQGAPIFDGCTIQNNTAGGDIGSGGGLYLFQGSGITLTRCLVSGNTSSHSAGGMNIDQATQAVVITDSTFENNTAMTEGGGIAANFDGSISIERSVFRGNTAGGDGGALSLSSDGGAEIVNCAFSNNSATGKGSAIDLSVRAANVIANCTFSNNSAPTGSVVWMNTFSSFSYGIVNSVFWGNTGGAPIVSGGSGMLTVDYSIVEGGWSGAGSNNLDVDPLFVDAANDDLRLTAGSPAIDSGDYDAYTNAGGTGLDLAGNPRLYDNLTTPDTGVGAFTYLDRGAYELPAASGACCLPLGDCIVISEDTCLAAGGAYAGDGTDCTSSGCEPPCQGDLSGDGVVDLTDLGILLANYGVLCP